MHLLRLCILIPTRITDTTAAKRARTATASSHTAPPPVSHHTGSSKKGPRDDADELTAPNISQLQNLLIYII